MVNSSEFSLPGEEPPRGPQPIDPNAPLPPRRLLRGAVQLTTMIGARLLVGLSIRQADGTLVEQEQFCGEVLDVADGVVIVRRGDGTVAIPADNEAFTSAPPGEYRLNGTGEIVVNPDFLTTWDLLAR